MTTKHQLHLQNPYDYQTIPSRYYFQRWSNTILNTQRKLTEITIRIVNEKESTHLNQTYRHKTGPTNVLAFPFEAPPGIKTSLLGDLAICAPLVKKEAKQQSKTELAHWAHLTIHGVLHLLGYDHIKDRDAIIMESLETQLLKKLGFPNPYE